MKNLSRIFLFNLLLAAPAIALGQQSPLPPGTHMPDEAESAPAASGLSGMEEKIAQKDLVGARTALNDYLKQHPSDAKALFDLGYVEELGDHNDPAIAAYKQAIAADPKQMEAQLALGLLLARNGKPDEARPYVEAATLLEPAIPNTDLQARAWRALAQLDRTSDPAKAKSALLQALKISPESTDDTLLTAEIAEASNDPEIAENAYRRVLAAHPESSPAIAGLVHLLLAQKKYAEAEPLLQSALDRDPDDPALNGQWAATLLAENKPEQAIATLERLHQAHPADPVVGRMFAETLSRTADYAKADAIYTELLAQAPNDADLLSGQGECLLHLQKYPNAIAAYQKVVKIRPEDGDAWAGLALASSEAKQYATTLDALSMRSKYLAETPATYFLRATAYDNLHQQKAAVEFYQKFLAAAHGNFPDQEWQAKHRLVALGYTR
ncbi:MAG TPA: tetratricopeptide repeat protein [Acidisarcina sp.]|nr:tetratricopeptide repeat protein [Acidisarcina sp.]